MFLSFKLPVAVKTLRSGSSRQVDMVTDFLLEVSTMQSLDHLNIIHLYGVVLTHPLKMVILTFGLKQFPLLICLICYVDILQYIT